MTLTEQWKNGELPSGWYYIELNEPFDKIHKDISYYSLGSFDIEVDSNYIIEVLAPVPSYEEWQASEKYNKHFEVEIKEKETQRIELMTRLNDVNNENHALEIENAKLKDLLKECIAHLTLGEFGTSVTPLNILLDEIDNAIGEKK